MTDDMDRLATSLTDCGYSALFGDDPDRARIQSIQSEPAIGLRLQGLVNNRGFSWQARFLASEFLFRYVDMVLHNGCDRASLQESYFQALRHNDTGNGLDWGFRKSPRDVGVLGLMVVSWGKDAESFAPGLDDDHAVPVTFFWRTPPHYRPPYRVKDFAALILSRVHGSAIDLGGPPEQRDSAIAMLKQQMI